MKIKKLSFLACGLLLFASAARAAESFSELYEMPSPDNKVSAVVAREKLIAGDISYAPSYAYPGQTFSPPKIYSFCVFGYHNKPQWKDIKALKLRFGKNDFSAAPIYKIEGPGRDKSGDVKGMNADYFESLLITMPAEIAQKIGANNGVAVTTEPASFAVTIADDKFLGFKQLLRSVEAETAALKKPKPAPKKNVSPPGLPITEAFSDSDGITTLTTEHAAISGNFKIAALALVAQEGKKLRQPFPALLVANTSASLNWTDVESITLSFGLKKLRLTPNAKQSKQMAPNAFVEVMTVRVPYKDFLALTKVDKFYVTVGEATMEVNRWQSSGIRELARRISH